jgi:hypothetical protein
MTDITHEQLKPCHLCGYTKADAGFHLDHYLCKNSGNAPWEIEDTAMLAAAPEPEGV